MQNYKAGNKTTWQWQEKIVVMNNKTFKEWAWYPCDSFTLAERMKHVCVRFSSWLYTVIYIYIQSYTATCSQRFFYSHSLYHSPLMTAAPSAGTNQWLQKYSTPNMAALATAWEDDKHYSVSVIVLIISFIPKLPYIRQPAVFEWYVFFSFWRVLLSVFGPSESLKS